MDPQLRIYITRPSLVSYVIALRTTREAMATAIRRSSLTCISHQFGVTAEGRGFNPAEKRHSD